MNVKHKEQLRELSQELRAYIYQHIQDFTPFFLPDSKVAVAIERHELEDDSESYHVTFVISGDGAEVKAHADDPDVYKATLAAKESLLGYLIKVQRQMLNEMADSEGEAIENTVKFGGVH